MAEGPWRQSSGQFSLNRGYLVHSVRWARTLWRWWRQQWNMWWNTSGGTLTNSVVLKDSIVNGSVEELRQSSPKHDEVRWHWPIAFQQGPNEGHDGHGRYGGTCRSFHVTRDGCSNERCLPIKMGWLLGRCSRLDLDGGISSILTT